MSQMRKITLIQLQAKRKDRYNVYLDGEFAFGLHQDVLLESGIAAGDELTAEQIDHILTLEDKKRAKEKALRLLAVRARSRKELSDRLRQAKFSIETIENTLHVLERLKLVNDAEFAVSFGRNRTVTKPSGSFLLRQELKVKGLNEEDIQKGLTAAFAEKSEADLAWELAVKSKKRYASQEELKAKKRVSDFLLRRGFQWDVVSDVIENWERL